MDVIKYNEYELIDAHAHIFPEKIYEKATESIGAFYDLPMSNQGSTEQLLKSGSEVNVSKYLVCSTATTPTQTRSINEFINRQCSLHSEFIGLGTLHPDMGKNDIYDEIEYIKSLDLKGIKLHPDFQKFNIDSPEAYNIYDAIGDSMPFLIHMGDKRYSYSHPSRLKKVLNDFPHLCVIAAHLGGYSCWDEAIEILSNVNKNLKFDTSSSLSLISKQYAQKLISTFGTENCFWGSDFPMWNHKDEYNNLLSLNLSRQENERIFSGNFKQYFNL